MKSIKVSILGRQYPLVVKPDDEQLMYEIAEFVDKRFKTFKKDLSNQSETTIMVLSCLSIAEELYSLKNGEDANPEQMDKVNATLKSLISEIKGNISPE
jgi:cell division protein ZapA